MVLWLIAVIVLNKVFDRLLFFNRHQHPPSHPFLSNLSGDGDSNGKRKRLIGFGSGRVM